MRRQLREAGIRVVLIPERAPNANAYAERFVRSIKEECFDRIIPIGEHHFRRAVAEFVQHIIVNGITKGSTIDSVPARPETDMASRVRRRPRLGGLLNFHRRAA